MKHPWICVAALRLLRWVCPPELFEAIEGDLLQRFNNDVNRHGRFAAGLKIIGSTMLFIRPAILLGNKFTMSMWNSTIGIANLKMGFRMLGKQKLFSAINILGLAVCMIACILIFQYAYYETTFDRQHPDYPNIYRLTTTYFENNTARYASALSGMKDGPTAEAKLPEVIGSARLFPNNWFDCTLAYTSNNQLKIFNENRLCYADPSILTVLHFPLIKGDILSALIKPFSIVLSASTAQKYFNNADPIGQTMHIRGSGEDHDYTVTGVMDDLPDNTHLNVDIIASASSLLSTNNFSPFLQPYTYVQLADATSVGQLEKKLTTLAGELYPTDGKSHTSFTLQPIADIHLYSKLEDEIKPGGDIRNISFLLLASIAVMCIAWINFINLNSSRSVIRGKEIGIRKATGATQKQIIFQFLTETLVVLFISASAALLTVYFLGSALIDFLGINITSEVIWNYNPAWWWLVIFLFSGLIIAAYFPARIMSTFNPAKVLKGKAMSVGNLVPFKRIALTFQFACTIILIITVLTFDRQFNFMLEQNLGINVNNTLIIRSPSNTDSTYLKQLSGFTNQLKGLSIIRGLATSTSVPGQNISWTGAIAKGKSEASKDFRIQVMDQDFVNTYGLTMLAGRNFESNDFPGKHFGDKLEPVILNDAAVKLLGYKRADDIVGNKIYWDANQCQVVGVVADFHQESLKEAIKPTLFTANTGPSLSVKLMDDRLHERAKAIQKIRESWNNYFPGNPFDYSFLEDDFKLQYRSDQNVASTINFFSSLAIAISVVGLFALSIISLNQRQKEVGIRKILGASGLELFRLLTNEYLKIIVIATLLALPVAYWIMSQWLSSFAFHFQTNPLLYIAPVIFVLGLVLITVGYQTVSTIVRNPADTLKHE